MLRVLRVVPSMMLTGIRVISCKPLQRTVVLLCGSDEVSLTTWGCCTNPTVPVLRQGEDASAASKGSALYRAPAMVHGVPMALPHFQYDVATAYAVGVDSVMYNKGWLAPEN